MRRFMLAILSFVVLIGGCSTVPTSFTPSTPGPFRARFPTGSGRSCCRAHVHDGVVEYPAICPAGPACRPIWHYWIGWIRPACRQEERLAFWINAYNAFAVKGILDGYAPSTLFGRYRYFIAREYPVGGRTGESLQSGTRGILIAQFREPRDAFRHCLRVGILPEPPTLGLSKGSAPRCSSWIGSRGSL
jgi:hypothetical protein